MHKLRFVVIGLSGYALNHINAVKWLAGQDLAQLTGVVALEADRKKYPHLVTDLLAQNIALYDNIDHFLETDADKTDVLTVPIGIHQHVPVSIAAMRSGLHVFCEKPIAATIQEVDSLIAVAHRTKRKVAIGFQYIPTLSIQSLKARVCDGRLGKVKSASLICSWPRSERYYARNNWAGKLKKGNAWILDTPANNAVAHFLFNLLYVACGKLNKSAIPVRMQAELYRANRIESADLTQFRFLTNEGANCFVIFSHCAWKRFGPVLQLECENGQATWQGDMGQTHIKYNNGHTEEFANPDDDEWRYEIFRDFALSIPEDRLPICTPEPARPHTLTINAMHESCPEITTIPDAFIVEEENIEDYPPRGLALFRKVKNLDDQMWRSFGERKMFSELKIPWARGEQSRVFELQGYDYFPVAKRIV